MILHTIKLIELEQISVDGFFYKPLVRGIDIISGNHVFDYSNERGKALSLYIMR